MKTESGPLFLHSIFLVSLDNISSALYHLNKIYHYLPGRDFMLKGKSYKIWVLSFESQLADNQFSWTGYFR